VNEDDRAACAIMATGWLYAKLQLAGVDVDMVTGANGDAEPMLDVRIPILTGLGHLHVSYVGSDER